MTQALYAHMNNKKIKIKKKKEKKLWYKQLVKYYSTLKPTEILTQAATQTNLLDIMLSKISQSQRINTA
jgi:hypothetical protein